MVNRLLSYSMASVTVKTTNSKRETKCHYCLLAGKGLNGTESNINNGLYFPGIAVQTGHF